MKKIVLFIGVIIFLATACNNEPRDNKIVTNDKTADTVMPVIVINKDSLLLATGNKILQALKNKHYDSISHFIAPGDSVHLSPYGFIGSGEQSLPARGWLILLKNNAKMNWGTYDGSGDPINLSLKEYINKFVYNADFLHAEKTAVDSFIKTGNSLNNLKKIYPDSRFIEYHFSGFDNKYGGMDWTSLRLVFKERDGRYYLQAIVHDQWTI